MTFLNPSWTIDQQSVVASTSHTNHTEYHYTLSTLELEVYKTNPSRFPGVPYHASGPYVFQC